jgi:hypothetical protein
MSSIVIQGDTSGSITVEAPAVAGTNTLTLPASTGTIVTDTGAQTIQFSAGTAAAPSVTTTGDTNTGIFFPAADTIAFAEGGTERMRIDSSGNLLIGTTSQLQSGTNHSIHIKSSNYPQITYQNTIAATGGSYWVSGQSSNDYWYLLPAPQNKGVYLTYTSTTGWSSFSDETLKENLVPIENALDKINTLRTVTGNYIDDPEHPHVFLIAQDVQAILPEAVHMNLDHNVLGMNYNEIIPLLTAGIKELKEENDTLKSQLSALETRIETLEAK